jgi:hypothetical protein
VEEQVRSRDTKGKQPGALALPLAASTRQRAGRGAGFTETSALALPLAASTRQRAGRGAGFIETSALALPLAASTRQRAGRGAGFTETSALARPRGTSERQRAKVAQVLRARLRAGAPTHGLGAPARRHRGRACGFTLARL